MSQIGEESGSKTKYQIILLNNLNERALTAHHNHTTASHQGVTKTLGALRAQYIVLLARTNLIR